RSSKTRREKLENIKQLSQYIKHSIETNHSIWLAHREGRTKDGHDKTASALIKMLWMAHREKSVPELMHDLNVIPVSISYEINPCDYLIAQEMYLTKKEGAYKKKPDEDLNSMLEGVLKNKGRIIVTFGQPLHEIPYLTDLASSIQNIDQQIHQNYTLFPIHYVAYHKLYGHEIAPLFQTTHYSINDQKQGEALLNERLALCSPETESFLLAQYANPVKNFIESKTTQCSSSPV
ncbi:MAG: glycerol acyltransferase, partial [Endozoicomonadaceae bacterium]|nr:glycerol acyltransferase [Endozoicomonadaceae bacterium]